jgi:Cd2+/Zn2+-exporting ATPase
VSHDHDHDSPQAGCCDHSRRQGFFSLFAEPILCFLLLMAGWSIARLGSQNESPSYFAIAFFAAAYVAGGTQIARSSLASLLRGRVTIDLLMVSAVVGSAILGEWLDGGLLLVLFSLSHSLESYILDRTRRAISSLMDLAPDEATLLEDGVERRVPVAELQVGQTVVVGPSERIPVDGEIVVGSSSIDQSPMTGESIPVDKGPGDEVFSGTLNQQGLLQITVSRPATDTMLARMVRRVEQAQSERATSQRFTEWFGERYTWGVLALTALAFIGFSQAGLSWGDSFLRAMTVLVVASPCAVVISIPSAILAAVAGAARKGILFKGGIHLENAAALKTFAFDKTGTLTIGRPKVVAVMTVSGVSEDDLLAKAAAVESHSEHPLARAIREQAVERRLTIPEATVVTARVGSGIDGTVDGRQVRIQKFREGNATVELEEAIKGHRQRGHMVMVVEVDGLPIGAIAMTDAVRPTALSALERLRQLGVEPLTMLTGDHPEVARSLAADLEIQYMAELLPEDKIERLKQLQQQHGPIGMIGDGMNDAPALATADVGYSLGGAGTDVALESADVVLMGENLHRLPDSIELARATQSIIRQNLTIAFFVMGSLLLTSLVYPLPLPLAVLGHEGSTLVVILNGLRMFWYRPSGAG